MTVAPESKAGLIFDESKIDISALSRPSFISEKLWNKISITSKYLIMGDGSEDCTLSD